MLSFIFSVAKYAYTVKLKYWNFLFQSISDYFLIIWIHYKLEEKYK